MNSMILTILESIMIVMALSMDAFIASFAYGTNKIKIPFSSVTVINVICSSILAISLFFGTLVSGFIPEGVTHIVCFLILFTIGILKLLESIIECLKKLNPNFNSNFFFSFSGLNFKINVFPDEKQQYTNDTKILKPSEAAPLSIALSLDGLAVGFSAALANVNSIQIVAFSLISDMVAVMAGVFIGRRMADKISFNLSWLSGILLIILAFLKLS